MARANGWVRVAHDGDLGVNQATTRANNDAVSGHETVKQQTNVDAISGHGIVKCLKSDLVSQTPRQWQPK